MLKAKKRRAVSDRTIKKAYKATGKSVRRTAKRISRCYMATRLRLQKLGLL
jgi:hypothetical protein